VPRKGAEQPRKNSAHAVRLGPSGRIVHVLPGTPASDRCSHRFHLALRRRSKARYDLWVSPAQGHPKSDEARSPAALLPTALAAVGVVFGDIGTSPLYTLQVAPDTQSTPLDRADLFGIISLILWALVLAVSLKYVTFVMRADNQGEGGILALLALLPRRSVGANMGVIAILVVAGAALLFGDGMITPAISVLSALEGLELAAPGFKPYVVPLTCLVLVGLFSIQRRGTGSVGKVFGPIMSLWFLTIFGLGLKEIVQAPEVLTALSPSWGILYFVHHGFRGLAILGVVVLAITGGEALYADMGHFGPRPIRVAWFGLVLPALAASYLGQGALVLREPKALANPFFSMVPAGPLTYALVGLAAMATTIASQALISGVFSLTHQAVQLGYFPRVTVNHTSREAEGQIYVPLLNWGLMLACIALVLGFKESTRLASAYGIAVSGTMAITSIVFFDVTHKTWKWPLAKSLPVLVLFLSFDIPFFGANLVKFVDGGYVPILVGAGFFIVMIDWNRGREALRVLMAKRSGPLSPFFELIESLKVTRVPGTAIYLTGTSEGVPHVLATQVQRIRSMAEHVVLLTVVIAHGPVVREEERIEVEKLDHGFIRAIIRFGYMEHPEIPPVLQRGLDAASVGFTLADATYYVGRETFVGGKGGRMGVLAESLFSFLSRNAKSPIDHFGLPVERVVELGIRLDL
jgi:KUP system potassium uptake protein